MKRLTSIAICGCLCVTAVLAQTAAPQVVERVWYDGDRPQHVWMASDEVAVIFTDPSSSRTPEAAEAIVHRTEPGAVLRRQKGAVAYFKIPDVSARTAHLARLKQDAAVRHASPVFYETPDARPDTATVLTGEIIVIFRDGHAQPDDLAKRRGMRLVKPLGTVPNAYLFDAREADDALTLANAVRREAGVAAASPNWTRNVVAR